MPLSAQFIEESRIDDAWNEYDVTGEGVILSVFDRGIDYRHDDFRNDDGTTRILAILDLSDDSGASDPDNPLPFGTVYTESEINAALSSGTDLATRDAVGHGTLTAGIAASNGRASGGTWIGAAPDASLVIVKFTSEGAPAHDDQPAESPFYFPDRLDEALDFVLDIADAEQMPVVVTTNFGSIQGPSDGTSDFARIIDERFGPGFPGRVFISGSSDDGGKDNHASGTISSGETIDLDFHKGHGGNLRIDLWYNESDRFDVEIITPSGSFGPYAAPATSTNSVSQFGTGFSFYHQGSDVDFFGAQNQKREILIDFNGATGDYTIRLTGATISDGSFNALLNPSTIFSATENRFESFVTPGYTIWDGASSLYTIVPNSYVHAPTWTDINGVTRTHVGNDVGEGALWPGSGVGPTLDGRQGITVSAPGNSNVGPVPSDSYTATFPSALIQGGNGLYGLLAFVSGANPVLTGVIALMLEIDPTLTSEDVREILETTAVEDSFTGTTPNDVWGGGKLDAYAAVGSVVSSTSVDVPTVSQNDILSVYPNPARSAVSIEYRSPRSRQGTLEVYDLLGRSVTTIAAERSEAETSVTSLNVDGFTPGIYFVRLTGARGTISSTAFVVTR